MLNMEAPCAARPVRCHLTGAASMAPRTFCGGGGDGGRFYNKHYARWTAQTHKRTYKRVRRVHVRARTNGAAAYTFGTAAEEHNATEQRRREPSTTSD